MQAAPAQGLPGACRPGVRVEFKAGAEGMLKAPPPQMSGIIYYSGALLHTRLRADLKPRAFTCRQELLLQKTIHLPLFLRLGSMQEANRLEGKNR